LDRSDAHKQRACARRVLHRLGAWPWAIVDDGCLPYGWDGRSALGRFSEAGDEFVDTLREWARPLIAHRARDLKIVQRVLVG